MQSKKYITLSSFVRAENITKIPQGVECTHPLGERRPTLNSRQKGARGERELAGLLREYGFDARRGQQFCGANGDADVISTLPLHIECKRVEKLNIYDAVAQAKRDSKGKTPAVFHRKNNCEWLVTMSMTDFMKIFKEYLAERAEDDRYTVQDDI